MPSSVGLVIKDLRGHSRTGGRNHPTVPAPILGSSFHQARILCCPTHPPSWESLDFRRMAQGTNIHLSHVIELALITGFNRKPL